MAFTEWNIGSKQSNGDDKRLPFLYLKEGKYTVRLLKKPVVVGKYFAKNKDGKTVVIVISDKNINDCPLQKKYPERLKNKASLRYGVKVIDRSDGKIKVMEFPYTVFKYICEYSNHHEVDPGAKDGADFTISVNPKAKGTDRYTVMFDGMSTLTNDEIKMYKETEDVSLENIYKIDTPEEVEKKLFGEGAEKDSAPNPPSSPKEDAPDTSDESFGSTDNVVSNDEDEEVPF